MQWRCFYCQRFSSTIIAAEVERGESLFAKMINDVVTDLDAVQCLRSNAPDVLETLRAVLVSHRANTISLVLQHEFAQSKSTTLYRAIFAAAREIDGSRSGGVM